MGKLVAALRKETGYSLKICREAAIASKLDHSAALAIINGISANETEKFGPKSEVPVRHGWIAIKTNNTDNMIAVVELRCESDFVARSPEFCSLAEQICATTLQSGLVGLSTKDAMEIRIDALKTTTDAIQEGIRKLQETIRLENTAVFRPHNKEEVLEFYLHQQFQPGLGLIGAIAGFQISSPNFLEHIEGRQLIRRIAQQVAGTAPTSTEEFLKQPYIFDSNISVDQAIKDLAHKLLIDVALTRTMRFSLRD